MKATWGVMRRLLKLVSAVTGMGAGSPDRLMSDCPCWNRPARQRWGPGSEFQLIVTKV
jgi:hypothetical protein